jgi:DNA-binding transcriptional regulator YdaS (Cro superfamily)
MQEEIGLTDFVVEKCGGIKAIASLFNISSSAVSQWKSNGIPASRVRSLVVLADHQVSPQQLRPDVFGHV